MFYNRINQNKIHGKVLLSILFLLSSALAFSAAPPQQTTDEYDLIKAIPGGNINIIFKQLQQEIVHQLRAVEKPSGLYNITISTNSLNLSLNHRQMKPMEPHISIKGIPSAHRSTAKQQFTPGLFNTLSIPNSIRITGLFVVRGRDVPGKPQNLFIVADFQDTPQGQFDSIARHLDSISVIPRPAGQAYLHHLTLAKIFPFQSASGFIKDEIVESIQSSLTDLWSRLAHQYSNSFPIDRIEYNNWDALGNNPTEVLWQRVQTVATAPRHAHAPTAPRPTPAPTPTAPPQPAVLQSVTFTCTPQGNPTILSDNYDIDSNLHAFLYGLKGPSSTTFIKVFEMEQPSHPLSNRYNLMKDIVKENMFNIFFEELEPLRKQLLATGTTLIINNTPDEFWGWGHEHRVTPNNNQWGQILMEIRDELRQKNGLPPVLIAVPATGQLPRTTPAAPAPRPAPAVTAPRLTPAYQRAKHNVEQVWKDLETADTPRRNIPAILAIANKIIPTLKTDIGSSNCTAQEKAVLLNELETLEAIVNAMIP